MKTLKEHNRTNTHRVFGRIDLTVSHVSVPRYSVKTSHGVRTGGGEIQSVTDGSEAECLATLKNHGFEPIPAPAHAVEGWRYFRRELDGETQSLIPQTRSCDL